MGILFKRTTHHCGIAFKDIMGNVYDRRKNNTLHAQNAISFYSNPFFSFCCFWKNAAILFFFCSTLTFMTDMFSLLRTFLFLLHWYELPRIIVYVHACFVDAYISTDTVFFHLTFLRDVFLWKFYHFVLWNGYGNTICRGIFSIAIISKSNYEAHGHRIHSVFCLASKSGSLFSANCEIISYWLHIADRWCSSL